MPNPFAILLSAALSYWWLLLVVLVANLLRLPAVKGWLGELWLHLILHLGLDRQRYRLYRNVTLPTEDGSTQIDHIVVSRFGVFVVETKNYGGWIFGKPRDKMWTQQIYRHKSSFQNPLRQNYKHVRTLAELVELGDDVLFSVIAFVGAAEFKTPMPDNVTGAAGCLAYIRARTEEVLSEEQVARIAGRIAAGRLAPTRATARAHVAHVRELHAQKQAHQPTPEPKPEPQLAPQRDPAPTPKPAAPACPRCGGKLDDYTFKTGAKAGLAFRGCVRFPACDYRVELPAS
jgi:hypothetical protein